MRPPTPVSGPGWASYHAFPPHLRQRQLEALTPAAARAAFRVLMTVKNERQRELTALLAAQGLHLDDSLAGLAGLFDWFAESVRPAPDVSGAPDPTSVSVCEDIGLFLGDSLLRRYEHLAWKLQLGSARNVSHHHAVIVGFRKAVPSYTVDFTRQVVGVAHDLVERAGSRAVHPPVLVRGHLIDVEALVAHSWTTEPPSRHTFVQYLESVGEFAE